jgi:pilus assembly protein CpaC
LDDEGGGMRVRDIQAGDAPRSIAVRGAAKRALAAIAAAAFIGALAVPYVGRAAAQNGDLIDDVNSPVRHVTVVLNKSRTLKIDRPFEKPIIGAPEIADVLPITDQTLYVLGKKPGTTNISLFDSKHQLITVIDVEVTPDTASLRNKILASTGSRGIAVGSADGEVVLSGEASDAVAASRAVAVAKGLSPDAPIVDAMKVAANQQVMLKVRILEVDRNAGRDLGVNWQLGGSHASGATGLGTFSTGAVLPDGTTGVGISGTFPGGGSTLAPFGSLLANIVNTHGVSIDVLLSALENKGLVKSLAEPDLVALSGESASFLAGGQIPVNTLQPGIPATYTVQYKDYGVALEFTPTVLNTGIINLKLAPSVTEIDTSAALSVSGAPTLTKRSASTSVELRDGQSFAIAGLLQAQTAEDIAQVPYLGSIPILGALFRSNNFQKHETDLVIIVSPHLVRPAAPNQRLATPFDTTLPANDVDLFLMGQTERKKKYVEYVTSGGDLKGPYGHILHEPATGNDTPAQPY